MLSRFERFTSMVSAIYRTIQKLERDEMEQYGLRGSYAQYLLALRRNPSGLTAPELRQICSVDKAAVSRAAADMEADGLICRKAQGSSLYRARLRLTEEGRKAADFVFHRAADAVELAGAGLAEEDRQAFYAALELICGNLNRISKEGLPPQDSV